MLQIPITPGQLRNARELLEIIKNTFNDTLAFLELEGIVKLDDLHSNIEKVNRLLEELPIYYYAFEFTLEDSEDKYWVAGKDLREAEKFFRNQVKEDRRSYAKELDPNTLLTVSDTSGALGPLERTAEDWANTYGKPYLVASTAVTNASNAEAATPITLPSLVLSEDGTKVSESTISNLQASNDEIERAKNADYALFMIEWESIKGMLKGTGRIVVWFSAKWCKELLSKAAEEMGRVGEVVNESNRTVLVVFTSVE